MTTLQDVLDFGRTRRANKGKPATPHDVLFEMGITDFLTYRKLLSTLHRELKIGGRYNDLLGHDKVFVLTENADARGRKRTGFGDNPPQALNENGPIAFMSTMLVPVVQATRPDYRLPQTKLERNALLDRAIRWSRTDQKQLVQFMESQDAELRVERAEREAEQRVAAEAQKRADEAVRNAEFMREMLRRFVPEGDAGQALLPHAAE